MTYEFQSRAELIRYLRSRASEHRARAMQTSPRTHQHTEALTAGIVYDNVASMIERSNVTVMDTDTLSLAGVGGIK